LDVRVIAATNIKLKKAVAEGKFREDLYYRLNIIPIEIPPLRDREDDIPEMVNKFLQEFNKKYRQSKEIEKEALRVFADYDWPGNVRELKNVMERLIITTEGDLITKSQVSSQIYSDKRVEDILAEKGKTLQEQLEAFERRLLERTYKQAGSGSEAARILGVNKSTISKKLKKYGL
jgi:TyrR family helix-turn-helix protein